MVAREGLKVKSVRERERTRRQKRRNGRDERMEKKATGEMARAKRMKTADQV